MCGACTSSSPWPDAHPDEAAEPRRSHPLIGVVGVCGAGKSTLVAALRRDGYQARQINQEHSYVPDLWRRFSRADVLIYLEASDAVVQRRLGSLPFPGLLQSQRERLSHAREHANIRIDTDPLTPEQVLDKAEAQLGLLGIAKPATGGEPRRPVPG